MAKFLIAVSEFNGAITSRLLEAAQTHLSEAKPSPDSVKVARVPGAFELVPLAAKAAQLNKWDAVICLGALVKGETPHFDYIAQAVANGLAQVSVLHQLPVVFGVLTTDTWEQAEQRCGVLDPAATKTSKKTVTHNKGVEFAQTALDMVATLERLAVP